jgi:hypothetical protein
VRRGARVSGVVVVPDVRALLADVGGIGPFFAVATDVATPGEGWVPVRALGAVDGPLAERIAAVGRALGVGVQDVEPGSARRSRRVAASIAFQGITAQLVAPLFAAVAVHGVLPVPGRSGDPAGAIAATLHWRPGGAGPWLWWPGGTGRIVPCPHPAVLGTMLAGLLTPVVAAVRAHVPVSERVLWGNVASSVASARRLVAVGRPESAGAATSLARHLLTTPPLAGAATLCAPEPPDVGWTFRRRSCCLYHRVPGGGLCGDCVLADRRPRAGEGAIRVTKPIGRGPRDTA